MAYIFKINLLPVEKYPVKSKYPMIPEGICIHNTANDASATKEILNMIRNNEKVSFHVAVDDHEVIQAVPFDRTCFACTDGDGPGNRKHIQIEICYSLSNEPKFDEAEKNAAYFTAVLLKKYGWDVSKVKKHQDFHPKNCPHRTLERGWQRFIDMVQSDLEKLNDPIAEPVYNSVFTVGLYDGQVEITSSTLNVRSARNSDSVKIDSLKKGEKVTVGYILYENDQMTGTALWGAVMISGKQGFIHLGYVKPVN